MDPAQKPKVDEPEKSDAYAAGLAKMAALEYEMEQRKKPKQEHFISKKKMIYIGVSIAISIVFSIGYNLASKGSPDQSKNGDKKIEQLLNSTQEVKNYETN